MAWREPRWAGDQPARTLSEAMRRDHRDSPQIKCLLEATGLRGLTNSLGVAHTVSFEPASNGPLLPDDAVRHPVRRDIRVASPCHLAPIPLIRPRSSAAARNPWRGARP